MKAEIDENGTLTIMSETPVEAFALRQWTEKYCRHDGLDQGKIVFRFSGEPKEEEK